MKSTEHTENTGISQLKGAQHIGPGLSQMLRDITYRSEHPEDPENKGISSGFRTLDGVIGGLRPSDLILIGARPGMGKTSLAVNIAVKTAIANKDSKVVFFSLDEPREKLITYMLASQSRIPVRTLDSGVPEPTQLQSLSEAAEALCSSGIYINADPDITAEGIRSELTGMSGLSLVITDSLQLLAGGQQADRSTETARRLKSLARELRVPVIVLSGLPRHIERREDKRPVISDIADLRSFGAVEQYSDVVLFLYRESYYSSSADDPHSCECIVAKNSHGGTGTVSLRWDEQFRRFSSV